MIVSILTIFFGKIFTSHIGNGHRLCHVLEKCVCLRIYAQNQFLSPKKHYTNKKLKAPYNLGKIRGILHSPGKANIFGGLRSRLVSD